MPESLEAVLADPRRTWEKRELRHLQNAEGVILKVLEGRGRPEMIPYVLDEGEKHGIDRLSLQDASWGLMDKRQIEPTDNFLLKRTSPLAAPKEPRS